jgi:hypothetical protein
MSFKRLALDLPIAEGQREGGHHCRLVPLDASGKGLELRNAAVGRTGSQSVKGQELVAPVPSR